jgi:MFS family permease
LDPEQDSERRSAATETDRSHRRRHIIGFWVVATAFFVTLAFSTLPTPLYVLYQARDHFSSAMLTVVYGIYAAGVIGTLFLGGHVSDWVGRKRILIPALLVDVVSAAVFLAAPSLPGLLVARVVSGIAVGLATATAAAYLTELHAAGKPGVSGRHAQLVATAANLGGIGFGPLAAGLLAQYAPSPLQLSYLVFAAALIALSVLVYAVPETARQQNPAPSWRPQRIVVPRCARGRFFAATTAGLTSFAVFGIFTSLAPSFLVGTMHEKSHAVAGVVAFTAFASGAMAQIAANRLHHRKTLKLSVPILVTGLALLAAAMWLSNLPLFVVAGGVTGAGAGLVFLGALASAGETAPAESRAEVLAAFFLGAYIGLSVPVIGLGIATNYLPAREVMLGFVVVAAMSVTGAVRVTLRARQLPTHLLDTASSQQDAGTALETEIEPKSAS